MIQSVNDIIKRSALFKLAAYLLFALLLAMPVADFLTVFFREHGYSAFDRASLVYRALVLIALLILCSVGVTRRKAALFILFIYGMAALLLTYVGGGEDPGALAESLLLLLKFFLFFLFYQSFLSLRSSRTLGFNNFFRIADVIMLVYSVAIVAGVVFGIDYFNYYDNGRWGVKGIVVTGNEASALLIVSLAWFLMKEKSTVNVLSIGVVMTAMLLSGTKASVVGLFMLVLGSYWAAGRVQFLYKIPLFVVGITVVCALLYQNNSAIRFAVADTWAYFEYQFYNYAKGSVISLLLSGRDLKLIRVYELILAEAPWVLLFGGHPVAGYMVEMDFFDLVALLGGFGAMLYFYAWLNCWATKGNVSTPRRRFKMVFLVTFLTLAFSGGHMFYSSVTAPFLALLAIRFSFEDGVSLEAVK